MKDLNSVNESQVMPLEKSFSKKLTKLEISPERERKKLVTQTKNWKLIKYRISIHQIKKLSVLMLVQSMPI